MVRRATLTTDPSRIATPEPRVTPASISRPRVERGRAPRARRRPPRRSPRRQPDRPGCRGWCAARRCASAGWCAPGRASGRSRSAGVELDRHPPRPARPGSRMRARGSARRLSSQSGCRSWPIALATTSQLPAGSARCASCTDRGSPLRRRRGEHEHRQGRHAGDRHAAPGPPEQRGVDPRRDVARPATTRVGWRRRRSRHASTPRMGPRPRAPSLPALAESPHRRVDDAGRTARLVLVHEGPCSGPFPRWSWSCRGGRRPTTSWPRCVSASASTWSCAAGRRAVGPAVRRGRRVPGRDRRPRTVRLDRGPVTRSPTSRCGRTWARPGGPGSAAPAGPTSGWRRAASGAPGRPEQMRSWNLSGIWRLPTTQGRCGSRRFPPSSPTRAPSSTGSGRRPPPRLVGHAWGRVLMAEVPGPPNHGTQGPALRPMVELLPTCRNAPWADRRAPGPRRPRPPAGGDAPRIEAVVDERPPAPPDASGRALERLVEDLPRASREIEACGIPDTLVHGDFHPGNVGGPPDALRRPRLGRLLRGEPAHRRAGLHPAARTRGRGAAGRLVPRRVAPDRSRASDPGRAADLLRPCCPCWPPSMYDAFCAAIEPDERVYHRTESSTSSGPRSRPGGPDGRAAPPARRRARGRRLPV